MFLQQKAVLIAFQSSETNTNLIFFFFFLRECRIIVVFPEAWMTDTSDSAGVTPLFGPTVYCQYIIIKLEE